jgi:type I restriction enzyme S subunit
MNLPETWVKARLTEICELNPRLRAEDRPDGDTTVTFVSMSAVDEHNGVINKPETRTFTEVAKGYTSFRERDVLLAKVTPCMENGKAAIARDLENGLGFGSTEFHVLRPTEVVLPEYVFSFIRQKAFRDRAASAFVGTGGLQRVPPDFLSRVKIPLPTLPEQQRIVDVLRQVETFGNSRLATQETLDIVLREQYMALFGNILLNEKNWPVRKISQVSDLVRGSSPRPQGDPRLFGGPVPRLMVSDLTRDGLWVNAITDSLTEEGAKSSRPMAAQSVVMAVSGAPGLTAILNHDACIHDGFVGLRDLSADLLPEFVAVTLNLLRAKNDQQAVGAVFRNLTTDQVKAMVIPVPPIEDQELFRRFLLQWQVIQRDIAKLKRLLDELTNALIIDAYSGELTAVWREKSDGQIAEAVLVRDQLLRERGTKTVNATAKVAITSTAQADATLRPARHWLLSELSEFQRQVLAAFTEYCQKSGQPLLVEDPDVFARFCDDEAVTVRLQAFGQSHGNRIRRSLSQLAALGLIAKITLPKQDLESGERDYLKAFRPLRPEEFTRMADVQALRKALPSGVAQQSYDFQVQLDYATSEHAGAGGMFQVISVEDEYGKDFTYLVDQGRHYASLNDVQTDIASALKVETRQVNLEAV